MTAVEEARADFDAALHRVGRLLTLSPVMPDSMPSAAIARALIDARTAHIRLQSELNTERKATS